MHQRPQTTLRLLGALLLSVLVHVVALWLLPITWQPPKTPQERVVTIRLMPKRQPLTRPRPRPKRVVRRRPRVTPPPRKRQIRRRVRRKLTKRRKIKKKRRKRMRKRRLRERRRVAIAVPRPPPPRRVTPQRDRPPPRPPKRRKEPVAKRPSYRHLDLRPHRLPTTPRPTKSARGKQGKKGAKGKKGKKGKLTPWAGKSRFARTMRAYHRRFMEDLNDRRGLVDAFFGTAQVAIDRCIEGWFQRNLTKHLTRKQLIGWFTWRKGAPRRQPQWKGIFTVRISRSGKRTVKLLKSRGVRKLDDMIYKTAVRCTKRLKLPKRLKGKQVYMKFSTATLAFYRLQLKNLLGLTEVRDAQSGAMKWKFTHFGSVSVSSNTLILRQTVN